MLESNELEFLMEAHSGLSAKIVEEAGIVHNQNLVSSQLLNLHMLNFIHKYLFSSENENDRKQNKLNYLITGN